MHPERSIATLRSRLRRRLQDELSRADPRDVIVFAIDGVPFRLAQLLWPGAELEMLESVFPTTSSTAWLTSLTGLGVEDHGVPGVVFEAEPGVLVNVYQDRDLLHFPKMENIFSDAAGLGFSPLAVVGDLEPLDCGWRDALLDGAHRLCGHRFYTSPVATSPAEIIERLRVATAAARDRAAQRSPQPRFVWCFIDADLYIHRHGYDDAVLAFLAAIDALAREIAAEGALVLAHSDHGLVRIEHDPELERLISDAAARFAAPLGGAGRTRWLHVGARSEDQLWRQLELALPSGIALRHADQLFRPGSCARRRVGAIVLVAMQERFISFPGLVYEHGGLSEDELLVPFAQWPAPP